MRLHRLELAGFGPFREPQVVDFDAFAGDGIFLIAGRTGAGKSSVLDGVTFALYGGVPRYDGSDRRLRSDHCAPDDPTRVSVEFSAAGRRWRVTRSPEYERPKQRGTGMTTEPHRAQLDELVDGEWIGRAARPVDVARELDEVLGLSQQQFLQVILLAQNRFAEFLLAKNDERQRLLRRLFGTRTYEGYQAALEQRRKDAEHALATAGDGVELLLGEVDRLLASDELGGTEPRARDLPARLDEARLGMQRAAYRAETLVRDRVDADAAHRSAEKVHAQTKALREKQEQRARSRTALAALEAAGPRISVERGELEQAVAAEALRGPIETAADARRAAERARSDVEARRAQWRAALGPGDEWADASASDLVAIVDQLTGELAVWETAESAERELERDEHELAATRAKVAEFEELLVALDTVLSTFPARAAELDEAIAAAQHIAGELASATQRRDALRTRLEAATEAERLEPATRAAEADYLQASARLDEARAAVTTLLRRRLAGHAGELAAALVDGEACAVCGATEHPAPAPATDDHVGDEQIAAAESARDELAAREADAARVARAAREALTAAAAKAGGDTAGHLAAVLADLESAVASATEAGHRRDALAGERENLAAAEEDARRERDALATDLAAQRETLAGLAAQTAAARKVVDAARGDFASVAVRIARGSDVRRLAVALSDALSAAEAAEAAAARAERDRDARVEASDLAGVAEALAALRTNEERTQLEARIREHEVSLRAERDRLRDLELDLAGEPEELVDLDATAAALADARERWSAAVDRAAQASQTSQRLADLVERAQRAHDGIAELAADHAVIFRLANTVAGRAPNTHRMTLESFVLAAELEEIVEAANLRLSDMSSGRYRLQHSDALAARGAASGLGLEIMDAHTGMPRPAQSLSGGETFLASLALALGLAEVVTARAGGVRLDTLFIDEGFGSLDDETLELAMRTLDELRQGGRAVGVISHVAAMKEQLPAQLLVEANAQGPSTIRQAAFAIASPPIAAAEGQE
ncbi:SMC family ATPase [Microbacterium thalassium]|uniref:AAA family ATPase n=1 Tax=Microbacterium TaxID=33882 RepID=UPI00146DC93F|nr:SMC family ATPase [Microbacterium thalassium]